MFAWILLAIIAGAALIIISVYNRLVALRQVRADALEDLNAQFKLRHDLALHLIEIVKKYAAQEKTSFENVIKARTQAMQAKNFTKRSWDEQELQSSLRSLLDIAGNYPALTADKNFIDDRAKLSSIETGIIGAHHLLNNTTEQYNNALGQFPAVVFASMLGFRDEPFFKLEITNTLKTNADPVV